MCKEMMSKKIRNNKFSFTSNMRMVVSFSALEVVLAFAFASPALVGVESVSVAEVDKNMKMNTSKKSVP